MNLNSSTNPGQFLNDVIIEHPISGQGATFSALGYLYEGRNFALFGRAGIWYWQSRVDLTTNVGDARTRRNGFDAFFGLGAEYRITRSLNARLEVERYHLDEWDVDFLSIGLTYKF